MGASECVEGIMRTEGAMANRTVKGVGAKRDLAKSRTSKPTQDVEKSVAATEDELFPIFAECGLTPNDLIPGAAHRYAAHLRATKRRKRMP